MNTGPLTLICIYLSHILSLGANLLFVKQVALKMVEAILSAEKQRPKTPKKGKKGKKKKKVRPYPWEIVDLERLAVEVKITKMNMKTKKWDAF